jgi:ADP-heptose:LPS heptosyltransferase
MRELKDVTIICVDTKNYGNAMYALHQCLRHVKPARCVYLTDTEFASDGIEVVSIPAINSKREYSEFVIKELYKYFDTKFCLLVQWDGYILNGDVWTDDFLNFDYIGASWIYDSERTVGNGGFSLRSHKLCKILGEDNLIDVLHPEDQSICIVYKFYLEEKYGIRFAPEELADIFAFETKTPVNPTFGFHNFFHKPFQETIMFTRTGAMGDVIAIEPLMHYFYKKGYRVVLNTLPQFQNLFVQHYFKVHRPEELDGRIKYKEVNLDMIYEVKPKQLHLKSYYEAAGVPESEMELVKPTLSLAFDPKQNKLFPKYAVIHYDKRQPGRNIQRVDWNHICVFLKVQGYVIIQIGYGEREVIPDAIQMSTPTEPFLMWVIGGADLFIGADSGPSNIAVAMDTPAIIFFGNVNSDYIHPDKKNITVIEVKDACDTPKCWHEVIGCEGQKCVIDEAKPPCVQFETDDILNAINKIIC